MGPACPILFHCSSSVPKAVDSKSIASNKAWIEFELIHLKEIENDFEVTGGQYLLQRPNFLWYSR